MLFDNYCRISDELIDTVYDVQLIVWNEFLSLSLWNVFNSDLIEDKIYSIILLIICPIVLQQNQLRGMKEKFTIIENIVLDKDFLNNSVYT